MRFSAATLFVTLPAIASLVAGFTVPGPGLVPRAKNGGKGGGGGGKGASSSAAASATDSSTATATSSAAASTSTSSGGGSGGDEQSSLTLDPAVIAKGFENDGQDVPAAGQVASLTSSNNFINFCATVNQPITNGQQITGGSCNPAPMGSIPSSSNMPSAKFTNPKNLDTIPPNQAFTVSLAIQGMQTGFFVNAEENYFAAPQQLNAQGQIQGHSHIVIEQLDSLTQTTPTDPTKFAFFKGLNDAAQNGVLTADVTSGLPEGTYKISTINTASNHQPLLVPIAQHGSLDDAVYFTVSNNGASGGGAGAGAGSSVNTSVGSGASASETSSAAGATGTSGKGNGGSDNSASTTSVASAASSTNSATDSVTDTATSAASTSTSTGGKGNGGGKGKGGGGRGGRRHFLSRTGNNLH
ncbi:hypothetical protein BV22DRAFT_375416 [Leucogyrophana mollusca]|uniref:Uncharacterized protein n=1 Tax=Leucogyrophana mollusca TaxID=85980 RepID=A0ACB8BJY2_9AGAM|nr:hypothetical protein BV22DRAFT_375416 [Leucogyrophana mollusca]